MLCELFVQAVIKVDPAVDFSGRPVSGDLDLTCCCCLDARHGIAVRLATSLMIRFVHMDVGQWTNGVCREPSAV